MIKNRLKVAPPKEGYFKIFDIQDMTDHDRGGYGARCKDCRAGVRCAKHGLEKRGAALQGDADFRKNRRVGNDGISLGSGA